jgi:hypothetical protein
MFYRSKERRVRLDGGVPLELFRASLKVFPRLAFFAFNSSFNLFRANRGVEESSAGGRNAWGGTREQLLKIRIVARERGDNDRPLR